MLLTNTIVYTQPIAFPATASIRVDVNVWKGAPAATPFPGSVQVTIGPMTFVTAFAGAASSVIFEVAGLTVGAHDVTAVYQPAPDSELAPSKATAVQIVGFK
jgi:hypothetical protein